MKNSKSNPFSFINKTTTKQPIQLALPPAFKVLRKSNKNDKLDSQLTHKTFNMADKPKTARQISNERRRGLLLPVSSGGFSPKQAQDSKLNKPKLSLPRALHKALTAITLLAVLAVSVGGSYALIYVNELLANAPIIAKEDLSPQPSTIVLDAKGEIIAELGKEIRSLVGYEELPQCVIDAFVSIEDSRFFVHHGFDLPRFVKAALVNVKSGNFSQGGSTFTMQMIKNSYFLLEGSGGVTKNIERKIQEIYLSGKAEDLVDKKTIFENYINKNNYGGPYRGIQKAAEYYFAKNVQDLSLAEAALLAGVINLPNYYNPFSNLAAATARRNEVLDMMFTHGYISEIDCLMAKAIKIEDTLVPFTDSRTIIPYQAYIDTVVDEVIEKTGDDPYLVPMVIYTAMETDVQAEIERILAGETSVNMEIQKDIDSATAVIRNSTGEIIALGGGKDYNKVQRGFNFATKMKKQPGSSIKPLLDYALAFEYAGYNTGMILYDYPINYPHSKVKVNNNDNKYAGPITIQAAVKRSRNVPAVVTLRHVEVLAGVETIVKYMNDIGMNWVTTKNYSPQLAIGGSIFQTNPLEMASGYQMLFNYGLWIEPHTVLKIEYHETTRDDYLANPEKRQAISPQAAWLSASLMKAGVDSPGAGASYILKKKYPVYGKTGTSDWGRDGLKYGLRGRKDKWLICCTTEYSMATWAGFDKAAKGHVVTNKTHLYNIPGRTQTRLLDVIYSSRPKPGLYKRPGGIVSVTVAKGIYPFVKPIEGWETTTGLAKAGATVFVDPPEPLELPPIEKLSISSKSYDTYVVAFTKILPIENIGEKYDQFGIQYLKQKPNNLAIFWGKITYNGTVYYNGGSYSFSTFNESLSIKLPDSTAGISGRIEVCGFYGFEKSDVVSATVCSSTAANPKPYVPPLPTCPLNFHYDSSVGSCVAD